jgi:hypothetical protein
VAADKAGVVVEARVVVADKVVDGVEDRAVAADEVWVKVWAGVVGVTAA